MPNINWDELRFIKDWSAALTQILAEAKTAREANDSEARQELQDLLLQFVKNSPPNCEALDKIARRAAEDLFIEQTSAAVAAISARMNELKSATGLIEGVTSENKETARSLQLKNVTSAIDKARNAVQALKTIERALANPDNDLLTKIEALLRAVDELQVITQPTPSPAN